MLPTELIFYDLKVAALVAVFYLFYMLLLARETTHTLNRIVLLSAIVLSAVLPLCVITLHRTVVVGTTVSVVDAPLVPFSWMQTMVLPRADWCAKAVGHSEVLPALLAHEEAHVRHRHSYDVVVVEVLTALQWFNPVVWFLRQELRVVHEYEADTPKRDQL